jgi:hypothetical protein
MKQKRTWCLKESLKRAEKEAIIGWFDQSFRFLKADLSEYAKSQDKIAWFPKGYQGPRKCLIYRKILADIVQR